MILWQNTFFLTCIKIKILNIIMPQNKRKERENSYQKWRDLQGKGTHKHMEMYLKYYDGHRLLSQSEESGCMWTQDKDGVTRELMWVIPSFGVFTYIYCLLIGKEICDCQNVSIKVPCVYMYLSPGDFYGFLSKSFLFLFLLLCYLRFGTFTFHVVSYLRMYLIGF